MTFTPDILTIDELYKIATDMQKYLEAKPEDQDEGLITRLELLGILAAKAGKCLADSKYHLDQRKNDSITQALKEAMEGDWSISILSLIHI